MIILIDEESRRMQSTIEYLNEVGFDIVFIDNVDNADEFVIDNVHLIDAIILDIMMPWGTIFSPQQTEMGLMTGYIFFKRLRDNHRYQGPVIIYSASNYSSMLNELSRSDNCMVVGKDGSGIADIVTCLNEMGVRPSK